MTIKKIRVVIVGGGFGGVKAALELANKAEFSVQLISNSTHFEYHGALYRSAIGHSPKEVVIPLDEIFKSKQNVEVVLDEIGYIDHKKKVVISPTGTIYSYDKVIFAMGNTVNYFGIEGLKEHTETMHNLNSTLALRRKLVDLFSQPHRHAIRIAVIGGGPSGIELASELPAFAQLVAKRHGQPKPNIHVLLVEASDRLLPALEPKASEKVMKRLVSLGVEVYLGIAAKSCKKETLCLEAGELNADLLIWTAGSTPVAFFGANSQVFTLGRGGRVVVDEQLQVRGHKNIFVLGDNADTPYSGMAQTALHDAKFVARNLKRELAGTKPVAYKPRRPLYVITAGGKWAVVQSGTKVISGLRGWRIRRKADLWIFNNFEPYQQAIKLWRAGNKRINF